MQELETVMINDDFYGVFKSIHTHMQAHKMEFSKN